MKKLLILLFVLLNVGCQTPIMNPTVEPIISQSAVIKHINESTVGLMLKDDEGLYRPYCTGIWISQSEILTAAHCVNAAAKMDHEDEENPIVIGQPINIACYDDVNQVGEQAKFLHIGKVSNIDNPHDLALVTLPTVTWYHEVSKLAKSNPSIGDKIHIIGHTKGLYWSYMEGKVSAFRESVPFMNKTGPWMQISAPIYYGDSGGGVFNEKGELVGVLSFIAPVPNVGFSIKLSTIQKFVL